LHYTHEMHSLLGLWIAEGMLKLLNGIVAWIIQI